MTWRGVAYLQVDGEPAGQPRVKAAQAGKFIKIYTPWKTPGGKKAKAFRDGVRTAAMLQAPPKPIAVPCRVTIEAYLPRPKAKCRKIDPDGPFPHTSVPDADNIAKLILDGIGDAKLMWADDRLVCEMRIIKRYVGKGCIPGAGIRIEAWDDGQGELFE